MNVFEEKKKENDSNNDGSENDRHSNTLLSIISLFF